jgi:peptide/nickel transport system permease protein
MPSVVGEGAGPTAQQDVAGLVVGPAGPARATRRRRRISRRGAWGMPWTMVPFLVLLLGALVVAVIGPWIAPYDPTVGSLRARLVPPIFLEGGRPEYLLGTDAQGRDILSRAIIGSQASLVVGLGGLVVGSLIGSTIGLIAGYVGGWLDDALMTLADIQLAFPNILLAIAVIAVLGPSLPNLIAMVGLSGWVTYARIGRSAVVRIRHEEFIEAVRCLGGSGLRIVVRHVLPNVASALLVVGTLDLSRIIIMESTLSFLGLGIQPPTPSWGGMIGEGRGYLDSAWWIAIVPGAALFVTTMSISRLGDWIRDVLDPTMRTS